MDTSTTTRNGWSAFGTGAFIGFILVVIAYLCGVLAFFPGGICIGPLTFSVEYVSGSWFPGRNM